MASEKLTALTEITELAPTDMLYAVAFVGGQYVDRKITNENLVRGSKVLKVASTSASAAIAVAANTMIESIILKPITGTLSIKINNTLTGDMSDILTITESEVYNFNQFFGSAETLNLILSSIATYGYTIIYKENL